MKLRSSRLVVLVILVAPWLTLSTAACDDARPARPAKAPARNLSGPPKAQDDAQRSLDLALRLQSEKAYGEAIPAFEQAFRLGHDVRALLGEGACYRSQHRSAMAYETYERISPAHDAELTPQQRQTVQRALAELAPLTGALVVNVSETDADVEIGKASWGKSPSLRHHRVTVGTHPIRVTKSGFAPFEAEVVVGANESKIVEAKLVAEKSSAPNDMPEAEKRSTARAAFQEGVALQEGGKCSDAIARFQTAQRLYDAPTHQLHLAQCLAATGKLLDAQETYESLTRAKLDAQAPDAFKKAQEAGARELPAVRARVPTLRLTLAPTPASFDDVVIQVNGTHVPADLLGVARPMNPGLYKIEVTGGSGHATAEVELKEHMVKLVELRLMH
jgi:tetratricopeptide (TPR) repeat protein